MKPAANRKWSRNIMLASVVLASVSAFAGLPAAWAQVPDAAPAASSAPVGEGPRLTGLRASVGGSSRTVTLTLDVSGEFSYVPSNSGQRFLAMDLPGITTAEPSVTHKLESPLVSSYRVVDYPKDGKPSLRLEVLLKSPAAADYRRTAHGMEVVLTPASSVSASTMAASPRLVPASAAAKANRLERINMTRGEDWTSIEVAANGSVEFKAFELRGPHRLVVDLPDVVSHVSKQPILPTGEASPLHSIRVGQFRENPPVTRVVVDLEESAKYDVRRGSKGLEIEVRSMTASMPAPKKAKIVLAEAPAPAPATMPAVVQTAFSTVREPVASPAPVVAAPLAPAPLTPVPVTPAPEPVQPAVTQEPVTQRAVQTAPMQPVTPPVAAPAPADGSTLMARANRQAATPPQQTVQNLRQNMAAGAGNKRFTGEPISVNFKAIDIQDFFRLIQEISGLNVIVDAGVRGPLTMVLTDVPWDQALDIVLHNNGLDAVLDGNVLRIASLDTLKNEQNQLLDLAAAQKENQPQVTLTRPVNYAKSADLAAKLTKFLSKCSGRPGSTCKSSITSDDRTNQLIITDYAENFTELDSILKVLDKRTQQVEIEARVVSASRQFVRELGSQLGLNVLAGRTLLGGNPVGGNNSPLNAHPQPLIFSNGNSIPLFSNFPAAGANTGVTISTQGRNFDLDLVLTAAEQKGIGKLLSRPKIITQNNIQGKIQQGVQIPIQTTINNTVSVIFQPVTLSMSVTPQITSDGTIFLTIDVTNSSIDPGIPRINGTPALDTQEANTSVLVQDGGTVVFGGVIQNQNNLTIQQVPLLGSIPVLGNFFRRTGVSTTTSELLFFVTPKII